MGDPGPHNTGQDKRTLAADIKGLPDAMGITRAVVVGHDWGGGVAQRFALDFPNATERLICIDIQYFPRLPPFLERDWPAAQLVQSWYVFLHLDPGLPERFAEAAGLPYLRWFFEHGSGPRGCPFTEADVTEYARWFTQPGRATAGFNLYRTWATVDVEHWRVDRGRVLSLPTLWIHGMQDPFMRSALLDLLPPVFTNLRVERFQACGHWVPEEAPDRAIVVLQDFLKDLP
jgi:pimeloyl-ACP methyl ester carboxylesterase